MLRTFARYLGVSIATLLTAACVGVPPQAEGAEANEPEAPKVDLLGRDLRLHWRPPKNAEGWQLKGGVLRRGPDRAGSLSTHARFKNFILEFEWKISENGNSGVKYRWQDGVGLEYQVLDDERHRAGKRELGRAGALYDLVAPAEGKPYKPAGQWNTAKIVARGAHIEHWLNGVKVIEVNMQGEDWSRRYQQSKYAEYNRPDFGRVASSITLQDHGNDVWYRNLRLQKLPSTVEAGVAGVQANVQ